MTDYTKLAEALRCCIPNPPETCEGCTYNTDVGCNVARMMSDAADAIEVLQKDLTTLQKCYEIADATVDEVFKQLPKRGEIVLCKECIHFTQGGWCDREFDWFPVDGNDFCSMAEKMEVQE